ncbi:sensor domain-containing protein [Micromonospora sp. WMMD812]|uniref:sensor domain-containing protein n=1 Tax=Micromonospora sp. WMMD812 TaxID=3015152 RepID=UPI00248BA89B|nr:sensor domain-containing protein [Micromonospora sp. WMMD812]WBB65059.1 sensor domain-containing protein [Micromonospora sp. WMMD812]
METTVARGHRRPGPADAGGDDEPASIAVQAARDLGHLAAGVPVASTGLLLAVATLAAAALSVVGIGLPLLDRALARSREVLDRQRRRVPGDPVPSPYRPATGLLLARLPVRLADPATYRDLVFQLTYLPLTVAGLLLPAACWLVALPGLAQPALHGIRPGLVGAYLGIPIATPGTAWLVALAALPLAASACVLPRGLVRLDDRLTRALLGRDARATDGHPLEPGRARAGTDRPARAVAYGGADGAAVRTVVVEGTLPLLDPGPTRIDRADHRATRGADLSGRLTWTPASSTGCAARSVASR